MNLLGNLLKHISRIETHVGFPFPHDSPFLHTFSKTMHQLRSFGILDQIDRKYASPHKSCIEPYVSKKEEEERPAGVIMIKATNHESTFSFFTD